jgi:hypothetical protein
MSKQSAPAPEVESPRVLTEEQVSSLIEQFRFMLLHEVKNMKLEVVENIGAMLARRSGIDKELRDVGARMEILSASVEGFAGRIAGLERLQGIAPKGGPRGRARAIGDPGQVSAPAPIASPVEREAAPASNRRGRTAGKGRYEAYNAAKRARKAGGAP